MIRKAKITDVPFILELINNYAKQGLMLPKNSFDIYRGITSFLVYEEEETVVGVCRLNVIWKDMAEVASLSVMPNHIKKGIGRKLVEAAINMAKELEIRTLFTLTYQTEFFSKCGFTLVERESLPHKVFGDCLRCPKVECCDETALIYNVEIDKK